MTKAKNFFYKLQFVSFLSLVIYNVQPVEASNYGQDYSYQKTNNLWEQITEYVQQFSTIILGKAQYLLGRAYEDIPMLEDTNKALSWYKESCTIGELEGCNAYYRLSDKIINQAIQANIRQDFYTAFNLVQPLAQRGNARAQAMLGFMYLSGVGIAQNYQQSFQWLKLAAEQGEPTAYYNLAVMYYRGVGTAQNYQEAMMWYLKATEQGNDQDKAQFNIGYLYEYGLGVKRNLKLAKAWYKKSCDIGNISACERYYSLRNY